MQCVVGNDGPLTRALWEELEARGLPVSPLALEGPRLTAIVVEHADTSGLDPVVTDEGLDEARRAVTLRGGEVVLVTDRAESDLAVRALRRSGVPYTLVRRARAIEDAPPRLALLRRTLAAPVTVRRELARALATELADGRLGTGATVELGRTRSGAEVARALRAAGALAWAVPAWLFALLSTLGAPTFDGETSGRLVRVRRAMARVRSLVALPWVLLVTLLARPALAQEADPCAHAEHDAQRVARLERIAEALDGDAKASAALRARAASERIAPLRSAVAATFDALRSAAIAGTDDHAARSRLEAVRLSFGDDDVLPPEAIARGCGPDHLADEAWASRALDVVVLCPGFLLLEADAAASRGEPVNAHAVAEASAFLLAHELGHVIDGRGNDARSERAADEHAAALLARVPTIDTVRALAPFCGLPADAAHEGGRARVERALRIVEERRSSSDAMEERRS